MAVVARYPDQVTVLATDVAPTRFRRVSWGAILAGTVIALVAMFALNMLGLTIGAATVNPVVEANPVEPGLAAGTVIWCAASNMIALFLGGLVASRMGVVVDQEDGVMHGLVTWGVVTLISVVMLTTSAGNVIGGLTSAASQAFATAGQAIAEVSPEVADALNLENVTMQSIENEVRTLTQPSTTTNSTEAPVTQTNTEGVLTLDQLEINRAIGNFLTADAADVDANRETLINLLAERTEMTPEEARTTVTRWEQVYLQVREDVEATTRQVSQTFADAVTVFAGAVFALMIAGAFAGGAGGFVGAEQARKHELVPEAVD
jgi:hypothetical protein